MYICVCNDTKLLIFLQLYYTFIFSIYFPVSRETPVFPNKVASQYFGNNIFGSVRVIYLFSNRQFVNTFF